MLAWLSWAALAGVEPLDWMVGTWRCRGQTQSGPVYREEVWRTNGQGGLDGTIRAYREDGGEQLLLIRARIGETDGALSLTNIAEGGATRTYRLARTDERYLELEDPGGGWPQRIAYLARFLPGLDRLAEQTDGTKVMAWSMVPAGGPERVTLCDPLETHVPDTTE